MALISLDWETASKKGKVPKSPFHGVSSYFSQEASGSHISILGGCGFSS